MVSKKNIADAVVKFISNDLLCDISDKHLKFSLCMAKEALAGNCEVIDCFLRNPVIANILREEDGEYELASLARVLKTVLSSYEAYPIVVPAIPMFAPKENIVKITASDVDKLVSYLRQESEA